MAPSGVSVTGAAQPSGLAGLRGVRSTGAARGRDSPARGNVSVAIRIAPLETGYPAGHRNNTDWGSLGALRNASRPRRRVVR